MKTTKHILFSLLAFTLTLTACVKEEELSGGKEGTDVSILVAAGTKTTETRALEDGDGSGIDNTIARFRVMIFRSDDGKLAYNNAFTPPQNPERIDMKTGVYDFVFIANDNVDTDLQGELDGFTIGGSKLSDLNGLSFKSASFANAVNIPMVSVVRGVKVLPDDLITLPGRPGQQEGTWTEASKTWTVALERLAVRLDVDIALTASQTAPSKNLTISNIPSKVYLFPRDNDGEKESTARTFTGDLVGGTNLQWERIILPESMFSDKTKEDNASVITLEVNGSDRTALIGKAPLATPADYTLPRNHHFAIEGSVEETSKNIDLIIQVSPWTPESIYGDVLGRKLNISTTRTDIRHEISGSELIHFWSNQSTMFIEETGYTGENGTTEFAVNDIFPGLTGAVHPNFTYLWNGTTSNGSMRIVPNPSANPGIYRLILNAGGLKKYVQITLIEEKIEAENTGAKLFPRSGGETIIKVTSSLPWQVELTVNGVKKTGDLSDYFDIQSGSGDAEVKFKRGIIPDPTPENVTGELEFVITFNSTMDDRKSPPLTINHFGGVRGEEWILSVDANNVLNLDGRGYIVYFPWGSLIGLDAGLGDNDMFDATDIAWAPSGYNKTALIAAVNAATTPTARINAVPYKEGTFPTSNNLAAGIGDPCTLAAKSGYSLNSFKMPSSSAGWGATDTTPKEHNGYFGLWNNEGQPDASFMPFAGYRLSIPDATYGRMALNKVTGQFWLSFVSGQLSLPMYYMVATWGVRTDAGIWWQYANMIRCVPK